MYDKYTRYEIHDIALPISIQLPLYLQGILNHHNTMHRHYHHNTILQTTVTELHLPIYSPLHNITIPDVPTITPPHRHMLALPQHHHNTTC